MRSLRGAALSTHFQMGLCAGHEALHEPLEAAQELLQALQTYNTPPLRL